jgi:hypothetical protein
LVSEWEWALALESEWAEAESDGAGSCLPPGWVLEFVEALVPASVVALVPASVVALVPASVVALVPASIPSWEEESAPERALAWAPAYRHVPVDCPQLQSAKTNPDPSRRSRQPAV